MGPTLIVVCVSLTSPGQDTNPSQVSSQQTPGTHLYLFPNDGKLSYLWRQKKNYTDNPISAKPGRTGDLVVGKQRFYNCAKHALSLTIKPGCSKMC